MSVALRLAERVPDYGDFHPNTEIFLAALFAPIYGRKVTIRRDPRHGRIIASTKPSTRS